MIERPIDKMMMDFRASSDAKEKLKISTGVKNAVLDEINGYRESPPDPATLTDWQDGAACRQFPEVMFQEKGERWAAELAKRACGACVVQDACQELALSDKAVAPFGIWGNMSERERRAHFRRRKAA
jgi:WhiB family redox-sensing transcriptional regulator